MSQPGARPLPGFTAALLLARLTLRRLLHSRAMLVTLTFALLPIAYAFSAPGEDETPRELWATAFEVSLLLLKGYGHKEIAALLGRSERTVRQHAVAVYRKSHLSGRAELAAFFLEDLFLPPPT